MYLLICALIVSDLIRMDVEVSYVLIEHVGNHLNLRFCCRDLLLRAWLRSLAEKERHGGGV